MKKIIVAGNWKMNKTYLEAKEFIAKMNQKSTFQTEVIIGVPSLYADTLFINNQKENVSIVLQNCSSYEGGAYTGEISAKMIASMAMKYCIVGHSERRTYFGETNLIIAEKNFQLIKNQVRPIFCIGETLSERESGKTYAIIDEQLEVGLSKLDKDDLKRIMIAYEPVWAIGTGKTASNEEAQSVHLHISNFLNNKYDQDIGMNVPILYGGSCNEKNARDLFLQPNIWGGLIGGASLQTNSFFEIIDIAESINNG